jgi:hypothetical protein
MDTENEELIEERPPRMEDIHPRMTADEKARALQEILRVLKGDE